MAGYYLVGLATNTGLVHHCSAVDGAAPLMAPLSTSVSPTRQQLVTSGHKLVSPHHMPGRCTQPGAT